MESREITNILAEVSLFDGIKELSELVERFPPVEIQLNAGEKYVIENALTLIMQGRADIVKESQGKDVYLKTVNGKALLGLATLFSDNSEYISTVLAKNSVGLLAFSEDFVKGLMEKSTDFSLRLVKLLCQKVRYLNCRIDFYTCSGAEAKVHEFLARSCDCDGNVNISMSKLSDTVGIARASLYRAVASLEEKGYIIKNGKKIKILK